MNVYDYDMHSVNVNGGELGRVWVDLRLSRVKFHFGSFSFQVELDICVWTLFACGLLYSVAWDP